MQFPPHHNVGCWGPLDHLRCWMNKVDPRCCARVAVIAPKARLPRLQMNLPWNRRIEYSINPHRKGEQSSTIDLGHLEGMYCLNFLNFVTEKRSLYFLYMFIPPVSTEQTQTRCAADLCCKGTLPQAELASGICEWFEMPRVIIVLPINETLRHQIPWDGSKHKCRPCSLRFRASIHSFDSKIWPSSSDADMPPSWLSQRSCPGSMRGQSWKWNSFMLL